MNAGISAQRMDQLPDPGHGDCHTVGKRIMGQLYHPPRHQARGTPFLNDDWMAGMLIFKDLDTVMISSMNYNAYLDEVVYLNKVLNKYIVIDYQYIQEFMLIPGQGKPALKFRCQDPDHNIRSKYIQVLLADSVSLFAVRKVDFVEDEGYPPSAHPDYYHPVSIYYVEKQDSSMVRIKLTKGQLINVFPDRKKAISRFIRQNHSNLSNEPDLVEVIRFVNIAGPDIQPFLP
ncbi:MAG: hypothetical protein AMS23_06245 [Bacteroides sp. SM1_62]|nr:MAG: hypothetical protein AMS26_10365 [Bacteroides sp. SM23_62]KPL23748.1 MAG: hypothetical protein AMS23_06245 [Bacteroides sp. SM1_62]